MKTKDFESRVRGCIFGAALGDALGSAFEYKDRELIRRRTGGEWIDRLWSFEGPGGPHGPWPDNAPAGTSTDDTRYNSIVLNLANERCSAPTAVDLAQRFLDVYEKPSAFFPLYADMAKVQFREWEGACRGVLGQPSDLYPGVSPEVLRERNLGLNYPVMAGLLIHAFAGLFFPGRAEEAYAYAFITDFFDVGYAKEATAVMAAIISLAVTDSFEPTDLFTRVVDMNPLKLGGHFGGPYVKENLLRHQNFCDQAKDDLDIVRLLSRSFHREWPMPIDPLDALRTAVVAITYAKADPLRSLAISVNIRDMDEAGTLLKFRDIDSYGVVTGAIVGAMVGIEAFPQDMIHQVLVANKQAYGFDLEKMAAEVAHNFR